MGAMDIMQTAALNQRLKSHRPDILVRPNIRDVEMLEVTKIDAVLEQSRASVEELRAQLAEVVDGSV
jgi:NTE family protein